MNAVVVVDEVDLPAGPEQVWGELVAELGGAGRWWVEKNTFQGDGRGADRVGSVTEMAVHPRGVGRPGPRLAFTGRTREAVPGRRLTIDYVGGCFAGAATFGLTPVAGPADGPWTRLSMEFRAEPRGWVRALGAVADIGEQHSAGTRHAFERLRGRLEAQRLAVAPAPALAPAPTTARAGAERAVVVGRTTAWRAEHELLAADGAAIAVTRTRPAGATGPLVVLSHGWGSSSAAWNGVLEALLAAGSPVVAYDLRGHGRSGRGRSPVDVDVLAGDLRTVLAAEAGPGTATVLVGHSGGGLACVRVAASSAAAALAGDATVADVCGVVLLGTVATRGTSTPAEVRLMGSRALTAVLRRPGPAEALLSRTMGPPHPVPARRAVARTLAQTPAEVRADFFRSTAVVDLRADLARLPQPVLVVAGELDRAAPPALVAQTAQAAGVPLRRIEDAGHALPQEAPREVAAAVLEVLGSVAAPGRAGAPPAEPVQGLAG
ncbi:alpha/beta fold hydrolase [Kineococcus sp. TRM81007]|uniref:alpha/beta fold hydrolase n=1 Tax=Kineococcus sp. TRM81007 TaxID=2925831 RepID=UPI0027E2B2A4|nr:alpha/beta fold hydrolase [Kineococcus sp. TRM81007]